MKTCRICKTEKPLTEFHKRSATTYRTECKQCHSEINRKRHQNRKKREKIWVNQKLCISCQQVKKRDSFGVASHTIDGLDNKCKQCLSEYRQSDIMKEYQTQKKASGKQKEISDKYRNSHQKEISQRKKQKRETFGDEVRAKEREYRRSVRQRAVNMLGGECAVCGEKDLPFLAIDHIFNDGAEDRKRYQGLTQFACAIIAGRTDNTRLQVLCHNHNKEKQLQLLSEIDRNDTPNNKRTKKCTQCHIVKPIGEFVKDRYKSLGRKSECKLCTSSRHEARRTQVFKKLGNKCACCGNDNPLHLEVDHVNEDGAEHRKVCKNVDLDILAGRIDLSGFQLLCANCNMAKYHNEGTCPHRD